MRYLILLLVIILIILLLLYFSKNDNMSRHLYDNNDYAHFSKITSKNIFFYPRYVLTSPRKFILNAGDALFIPKKWWHWVYSFENTLAVNYWWSDNKININLNENNPKLMKNFILPFDILKHDENINNFQSSILNSYPDTISFETFKDYKNNNKKNTYLLTLEAFVNNNNFKSSLDRLIEHPKFVLENNINNNYNFWYCIKKMDTGLHFDDNYGLLCVLSGSKEVFLYPPSDSKYLYPYPNTPKWVNNKTYEDLEFNIYKSNGILNNQLSSSNILYETMRKNKKDVIKDTITIVDHLVNLFGYNKIIWGAKCMKNSGEIYWEYYFYNIDKNHKEKNISTKYNGMLLKKLSTIPQLKNFKNFENQNIDSIQNVTIVSFEVHNNLHFNPSLDVHFSKKSSEIVLPFHGETMSYDGKNFQFKSNFVVMTLEYLKNNFENIIKDFKFEPISNLVNKEFQRYPYIKNISIYRKSKNYISLQWYGLTMDDFIKFLTDNNWPKSFIEYYHYNRDSLEHIRREITINYIISENDNQYSLDIHRTSIYGSI
jgi:hypothetical protein